MTSSSIKIFLNTKLIVLRQTDVILAILGFHFRSEVRPEVENMSIWKVSINSSYPEIFINIGPEKQQK